jgi:hypothetical protein
VYGDEPFFFGLTYTDALEFFGVVAATGVFLWAYSREPGRTRTRLVKACGETFLVFGVLIAGVVYVETRLLWGEILPGIHVWGGLQGGGGYPWGTEQVAYNTCFVPSPVRGDCAFLNYNELLLIALLGALVGFLARNGVKDETSVGPERMETFQVSSRSEVFLSGAQAWCLNRDVQSRFLEYAKHAQYSDDTLLQVFAGNG